MVTLCGYPVTMTKCTADATGIHEPNSQALRDCPVHGVRAKVAKTLRSQDISGSMRPSDLRAAFASVQTAIKKQRLSAEQNAYFDESVINDEDGNLLPVYHGSAFEFNEFDPARLGRGNDAWGNGFYFTPSESIASGYAKDSGSATANVKEFYLNITNPIRVDGREHMSLVEAVSFTPSQAEQILMKHPDMWLQPNEESADDAMNPLGDYLPEFWDKDEWSKPEMESMVRKVAREYFSGTGWVEMETAFGRERGAAFLEAVHEVTGHDGVVVDFGPDEQAHYVAWFPNQMKRTDNLTPDEGSKF